MHIGGTGSIRVPRPDTDLVQLSVDNLAPTSSTGLGVSTRKLIVQLRDGPLMSIEFHELT